MIADRVPAVKNRRERGTMNITGKNLIAAQKNYADQSERREAGLRNKFQTPP
jgi:hypothetical protein